MAGLEGASAGKSFDRGRMERILAGLGKRVFLLNNVHENEPVTFQTRWTLSYLRGPMTREQIKSLTAAGAAVNPAAAAAETSLPEKASVTFSASAVRETQPPILSPGLNAYYLPAEEPGSGLEYYPAVLAGLDIHYTSAKHQIDLSRRLAYAAPLAEGPVPLDWDQAVAVMLDPSELKSKPDVGASFADLPAEAKKQKAYDAWRKDLVRWFARTARCGCCDAHVWARPLVRRNPGPISWAGWRTRPRAEGSRSGEAAPQLWRQVHHA